MQNSVAGREGLRDYSHRSAGNLLLELNWLPAQLRLFFKIACLTYKNICSLASIAHCMSVSEVKVACTVV